MILNANPGGGGKMFASGTGNIAAGGSVAFTTLDGTNSNVGVARVTQNFGFVPSMIIVTVKGDVDVSTIYRADSWTTDARAKIKTQDDYYYRLSGNAKVSDAGFALPIFYYQEATFEWIAYE